MRARGRRRRAGARERRLRAEAAPRRPRARARPRGWGARGVRAALTRRRATRRAGGARAAGRVRGRPEARPPGRFEPPSVAGAAIGAARHIRLYRGRRRAAAAAGVRDRARRGGAGRGPDAPPRGSDLALVRVEQRLLARARGEHRRRSSRCSRRSRQPRARAAARPAGVGGGAERALGRRARLGAHARRPPGGGLRWAHRARRLGSLDPLFALPRRDGASRGGERQALLRFALAHGLGTRPWQARRLGRRCDEARPAHPRGRVRRCSPRRRRAPARQLLHQPPRGGLGRPPTGSTCATCSTRPRSRRSRSAGCRARGACCARKQAEVRRAPGRWSSTAARSRCAPARPRSRIRPARAGCRRRASSCR